MGEDLSDLGCLTEPNLDHYDKQRTFILVIIRYRLTSLYLTLIYIFRTIGYRHRTTVTMICTKWLPGS